MRTSRLALAIGLSTLFGHLGCSDGAKLEGADPFAQADKDPASEGDTRGQSSNSGSQDGPQGSQNGGAGSGGTTGAETSGGDTGGGGEPDGGAEPEWPALALTLDQLQMAGTHNSYHQEPAFAFDASHKYTHAPLDTQLQGGVRALELDLHLEPDGEVHVYHIAVIDSRSSCDKLDDCLNAIASFHAAAPRHTPIFVWFEIKDSTGGVPFSDLNKVEEALLRVFARSDLLTPDDLAAGYATPRERIDAEGWPLVDDVRGKIAFIVLNRDEHAQRYTQDYTTLAGKLMFANARPEQYGLGWAVISKEGPNPDVMSAAHAAKLMLATNTCSVNDSDEACAGDRDAAIAAGIHMLKDDLPFPINGRNYWLELPGGSPGCNPVTAPADCDASVIE